MPKAPADYQMRYPIDFAEIGPNVHKVVQLYAQDLGKSRGILWMPATGKPKTCVIMAHPRAEFGHHYSIPFWVEAGFAAFAHNTRYLNNDSTMIHESILLDLAAAMKYLREEEGFEHIVMLGNSGGGSLFSYYDAQARTPKGNRVASPPGGGPPDLNKYDFPTADGFIVLAAHPGQGMVLMNCLDAAVVDENDPLASDPDLDMYDERNGFNTPPAESRYSPEFLAKISGGTAGAMRSHRRDRAPPHRGGQQRAHRDARRELQDRAAGDAAFHRAPRDGAAHDVRLSHAGESELPRLVARSIGARGRLDHFAAAGYGELRRVRTRARHHAGCVAIDMVGAVILCADGGESAEGDGTDAGGGRERRPGHLPLGREGGV